MKQRLPDTSISAYKMLTPEMIAGHHGKIIGALQQLGTASYETIATHVGMDRHQVGRRLSELERMGVVYKPGSKSLTKSGRAAYNYCLSTPGAITDNQVKQQGNEYKKGTKTAADFASDIIRSTQQTNLFP